MPKKGNQKHSKFPLYFEKISLYILGAKWERLETVFRKTQKSPYLEIPSHIKKPLCNNLNLKMTFDDPP